VTRYDRVIPPGGTGQITLGIDTSKEIDEFEKKAVVWSNDPQRKSVTLYLKGEVKPHISLIPGGYLSLQGVKGQVPVEKLEIINNHKKPFKIKTVIHDLPDHIHWRLNEIKPGYSYTLEVEDISTKASEFSGHIVVQTDLAQKPELVIVVTGYIQEN
jgi:hypothetical protein